jgi:hypothetical protein
MAALFQINFQLLSGEVISLQEPVENTLLISQLKIMLLQQLHSFIPSCTVFTIENPAGPAGSYLILDPNNKLSDYPITNPQTIHVLLNDIPRSRQLPSLPFSDGEEEEPITVYEGGLRNYRKFLDMQTDIYIGLRQYLIIVSERRKGDGIQIMACVGSVGFRFEMYQLTPDDITTILYAHGTFLKGLQAFINTKEPNTTLSMPSVQLQTLWPAALMGGKRNKQQKRSKRTRSKRTRTKQTRRNRNKRV